MRFVFLVVACFGRLLLAQDPFAYHLNDDTGLPSNEVYRVLQDSFGYIWIGCDAGLFRYDGFNFRPYKNPLQSGRSISSLQLDPQGRVWAANFHGQFYCVINDSLHIAADYTQQPNTGHECILDADGHIWLVAGNNLLQLNSLGDTLTRVPIPFWHGTGYSFVFRDSSLYFTNTTHIAYEYNLLQRQLRRIHLPVHKTQKAHVWLKFNQQLYLWAEHPMSEGCALWQYKQDTFVSVDSLSQKINRTFRIEQDRKGDIWLCSSTGIYPQNPKDLRINLQKNFFKDKKVSSIYLDREGQYWVTTLQDGIFIIPNMEVWRYNSQNSPLPESNITAIALTDSGFVAGSQTGQIYNVSLRNPQPVCYHIKINAKTVTTKKIRICGDEIWASHGPLSIIPKHKKPFQLPIFHVRDFSRIGDTVHYVNSDRYDQILLKDPKPNNPIFVSGRAMAQDSIKQIIYYALNDKLLAYKQGDWQTIQDGSENILAVSLAYKDSLIYAGTVFKGLFVIQGTKVLAHWNSSNSDVPNEIKLIHFSDNFLWLTNNDFLYKFARGGPPTLLAKYSLLQGINAKDINDIASGGGLLYFATHKGVVSMPESLIASNSIAPKIYLSGVSQDGHRIPQTQEIQLDYTNKNIAFYLSSVALRSRGQYYYEYSLPEIDSQWQRLPANNQSVFFQRMPPGQYSLRIRAVNESGVRSETLRIALKVASPIWQRWWFYLLSSLFLAIAISLFFSLRLRFVRRQAENQKKLLMSQLTALKAQMHPHFMYNALNSIQSLILQQDVKNAALYLSKFSSLMRKVLDSSSEETITLQEEINILRLYLSLEQLRFDEDFEYSIVIAEGISPENLHLPPMLLQPFVENALKHGLLHKRGGKRLDVAFRIEAEQLICRIEDNGIGRAAATAIKARQAQRLNSFSTTAAEKRINLLNSVSRQQQYLFRITDLENPTGTVVEIFVPLSAQSHV